MAYVVDHETDQYGTNINSTTELLPYVPQTYNDLLGAIAVYGAYVKLESDFDFSVSNDYKIGIPEIITIRCAKLFADDKDANGNKYLISGINARALSSFMYVDGYDQTTYINPEINNIGIVNCVYSDANSNLWTSSSATASLANTRIDFVNCQLSFLVICNQYAPHIDGAGLCVTFTNTSEYYKFIQDDSHPWNSTAYGLFSAKRYCCTVKFTGLKLSKSGRYTSSVANIFIGRVNNYIENTTFYGDVKCIPEAAKTFINMTSYKNCAFIISFDTDTAMTLSSFSGYQSTTPPAGVNIIDSTVAGANISIPTSYNAVLTTLTTTEMKDENTLISVGFLP